MHNIVIFVSNMAGNKTVIGADHFGQCRHFFFVRIAARYIFESGVKAVCASGHTVNEQLFHSCLFFRCHFVLLTATGKSSYATVTNKGRNIGSRALSVNLIDPVIERIYISLRSAAGEITGIGTILTKNHCCYALA